MGDSQRVNESDKKGKVTIGGIAAADLRSLYLHALLPKTERGPSSGKDSLLLILLAGRHGGRRLELCGHVGDQLAPVQLVGGAVLPRRAAEGEEGGRGPGGEDAGHQESKGDKADGEGEQDEGDDAGALQVCVGEGKLLVGLV